MTTVALLGTGPVGYPVARRLLAAGFAVRVWNETVKDAAGLVLDGAYVAPFPARAAEGADVLLTLLPDAGALHSATSGRQGALGSLRFGAVWVQMGDIGVDQSAVLRRVALQHRVRFVEAPFTGSEAAAREGKLMVLASGSGRARAAAEPVLDEISSQTLWVDRAGGSSRLKHALHAWVASLAEGSAERAALSAALRHD